VAGFARDGERLCVICGCWGIRIEQGVCGIFHFVGGILSFFRGGTWHIPDSRSGISRLYEMELALVVMGEPCPCLRVSGIPHQNTFAIASPIRRLE